MSKVYSTRDVANELGAEVWRIRRIFERGDLEEPPIVGGRRMIDESMIPQIIHALSARGWWRGTADKTSNATGELSSV